MKIFGQSDGLLGEERILFGGQHVIKLFQRFEFKIHVKEFI